MKAFCCKILSTILLISLLQSLGLAWQKQETSQATKDKASSPKQGAAEDKPIDVIQEQKSAEKKLLERVFYILDGLANSKEIEDKLEAAHMKADIAALVCDYGNKPKAVEVLKKSLTDIAEEIANPDRQKQADSSKIQELTIRVADTGCKCDPSLRSWFVKELERLRNLKTKPNDDKAEDEAPVVAEETWGTKPSMRRQIAADILTQAAHEKIAGGKLDEARQLLSQSLNYCLSVPFITALIRLKENQADVASNLYFKASRIVQVMPSGAEVGALNFGLKPLFGIRIGQESPPLDKQPIIETYLLAVSALINCPQSSLAAKSPDILRMVKDSLPLYATFQPAMHPQIELWVAEGMKHLPANERSAVEQVPFAPQSLEQQVSKLEDIAYKSADEKERDLAYASIASTYITQAKLEAAFKFISRIADINLKNELLDEMRYKRMSFELSKATELLPIYLDISSVSSLTLRVKLYMQLGQVAAKKDSFLAHQALDEAARLTNENVGLSATHSHFLFGIASLYSEFDSIRAFEVLSNAVKSVSKHQDQPASKWGHAIAEVAIVKFDSAWRFSRTVFDDPNQYKKPYDLSAFRKLSSIDIDRVLLIADYLEDKPLQANAKYEVCAGILLFAKAKKEKSANTSQ
ncbi:MAG: hypothetical protein AB1757_20300 [Acidobacteriota bacterium]